MADEFPNRTDQQIATNIKHHMRMKGLSQAELARRLNFERTTVSKHLSGGIRNLETAAEYASALSIPLSTLILPAEGWEKIGENKTLGIDIAIRLHVGNNKETRTRRCHYEKP